MKSRTAIVSLLGAAVVLLASCATSVPVTVTRPAELDLHGAKTVSVLPFQISDDKDLQHTNSSFVNVLLALDYLLRDDDKNEVECANYLSTQLTSKLSESTYLTLVDADVVKTALAKGKKAPVDVYLTGKISNFKYGVDDKDVKEKEDDEEFYVTYYSRWVRATIVYEVVDSKTNQIIAYREKEINQKSTEQKKYNDVPSVFSTVKNDLNQLTTQIMKEIQPYQETKYLSLLKDKTKNPELKLANSLAKEGMVVESRQKYYAVYKSENNFEAGYNAAKLLQAEGKLEESKKLMTELVNKFGDKRAISGLRDIQYEIDQSAKLQNQLETQSAR